MARRTRPPMPAAPNALYYGDNLRVLREDIAPASVDLVYLDPPFNSKRDYNLLFRSPKGDQSEAQITAFEDTWHWGPQAEEEFDQLLHQPNTDVAGMMTALRSFLGRGWRSTSPARRATWRGRANSPGPTPTSSSTGP